MPLPSYHDPLRISHLDVSKVVLGSIQSTRLPVQEQQDGSPYQIEPPATSISDMLMPRASSRQRNTARAAISAGGIVRFCG